jgi:hypothetical protein
MKINVKPVDVQYVHTIWPSVRQYIDAAVEEGLPYDKDFLPYNVDHMLAYVASGQWVLLAFIDEEGKIVGAGTLSFINYPLYRAAIITSVGGKFLVSNEVNEQIKDIARDYGATVLQAYCRDSMVRLLSRVGYEPHNRLVEQKL